MSNRASHALNQASSLFIQSQCFPEKANIFQISRTIFIEAKLSKP